MYRLISSEENAKRISQLVFNFEDTSWGSRKFLKAEGQELNCGIDWFETREGAEKNNSEWLNGREQNQN